MAMTRNTAIFIATAILFLSGCNMFYNTNCSYHDVHPEHVDPSILVPPANVTYINATNTLIVDAAREWQLQSQVADVKFLDYILWVVALGSKNLVYAPYHDFQRIIDQDDLRNTVVTIEKSKWDRYGITVIKQRMTKSCNLTQHYSPTALAVTGHQLNPCVSIYTSNSAYQTDSYSLNSSGNLEGYRNCYGGTVASPAEIVSEAVFKAVMFLWVASVILMVAFWKQEDTQEEQIVQEGKVQ